MSRREKLRLYRLKQAQLRRRARRNSAAFGAYYRGIVPGPQQWQMAARADNPDLLYQADFWPRDHGKTEIFVTALPLRRLCQDPNIRVLIVQKTGAEARKAISVIKTELEENARLRRDFAPHWLKTVGVADIVNKAGMVDDKTGAWQASRIYVKRRRRSKDPTVEAVGVGGAITGGHFDLIVCDDILDDENTKTQARCQAIIDWFFGTIMQLREPHTKIIVVGTLKTMLENLYGVILDNPMWNSVVESALLSHGLEEIQYAPVTETVGGRQQIVDVAVSTPGVQTLWPAVWPIEALLLDMLGSPPRIWRREKLNDLLALAERIFKREWWRGQNRFDPADRSLVNRCLARWLSWDTGLKDTGTSAYSACTVGELTPDYRLLIRQVWRGRLEFPELPDQMELMARRYNADGKLRGVIIEDKASGTSAFQTLAATAPDWLRPLLVAFNPTGTKEQRADQASVWCRNGGVLLPRKDQAAPWLVEFEKELFDFPVSTYKDQVDSFSQLVIFVENLLAEGWRVRAGGLAA